MRREARPLIALPRLHVFEFEDQAWFPRLIRDAGTAYLEFVARKGGQAEALAPLLSKAMGRTGESHVIDLCSGGSGPLPTLIKKLADEHGERATVTLTDLYPNREAFERVTRENDAFRAIYEPVDAMAVSGELEGLRTLFNGFHHFRPAQAKRILRDAVESSQPIAIFELVARRPMPLFGMFFVPFLTLFTVPFLRPFRWGWLPFTYLIPLIPLFVFWDGFISCLRCYTSEELLEMTRDVGSEAYEWEVGPIVVPGVPFDGCYLIGSPTQKCGFHATSQRNPSGSEKYPE